MLYLRLNAHTSSLPPTFPRLATLLATAQEYKPLFGSNGVSRWAYPSITGREKQEEVVGLPGVRRPRDDYRRVYPRKNPFLVTVHLPQCTNVGILLYITCIKR